MKTDLIGLRFDHRKARTPVRKSLSISPGRSFFLLIAIIVICWYTPLGADEFQISLNSGSVITISSAGQSMVWTDVMDDGTLKTRDVDFADVSRLSLTWSPASQQVAEIRRCLTMLSSDDYHEREHAEAKLKEANIGGRFLPLIRAEAAHPKREVRYRINRILTKLESGAVDSVSEFDLLTLKDGTTLEGDAGDFEMQGVYRDRQITLPRAEISLVSRTERTGQSVDNDSTPVKVEVFQQPGEQFYQPHQTLIDFETSPSGSELNRNTDVSEMFVPNGLILGTEEPGFVGISGYGFKIKELPPKDNSVCVFKTVGKFPQRFKGVMELEFCLPNQPSVRAGVHELGLFIARVNHSRDFILEAYNADGQILGTVEASDLQYVFMGIKSSEPITFVRILSNPFLFRVNRKIDEDFAIDHVCFSAPVAVSSDVAQVEGFVKLKNGDLLKGELVQISAEQVEITLDGFQEPFVIPLDEVQANHFENASDHRPTSQRDWFVMLNDRSVLKVTTGVEFTSTMFGNLRFDPDEITAIWPANNTARLPTAGDFERGKYVLVFPTCRIVADTVEFSSNGYQWDQGLKIEQDVKLDEKKKDDDHDDPTPDVDEVNYVDSSIENIPTIWTKPPQGHSNTGRIRFVDGQQLTLGKDSRFQISVLNTDSVTISAAGQSTSIPLKKVLSIDLPDD